MALHLHGAREFGIDGKKDTLGRVGFRRISC
jgi:hypothetical protein